MKLDLGEMHEVMVGGDGDPSTILLVKHLKRTTLPEPGSGFEKIVLVADDVDTLHDSAIVNGGSSVKAPWDLEKMGIRVGGPVRDPDGYLIERSSNSAVTRPGRRVRDTRRHRREHVAFSTSQRY